MSQVRAWAGGMVIAVLSLVVIVAVVVGLWLGGVFASPAVGRANAYKDKHSATNWTQAQAGFERDWASIKKLDKQAAAAKADMDAFDKQHPVNPSAQPMPGDPVEEQRGNLSSDYRGARQQCQNAVADYNAAARTYTLRDFRSADLPEQIDDTDPATDCR